MHRPTVTRAEVDDYPVGSGDLLVDLADVDLEDAPADDLFHGDDLIRVSHWQVGRRSRVWLDVERPQVRIGDGLVERKDV